eukprot:5790771-Pyramimonas_sp.AAC.1
MKAGHPAKTRHRRAQDFTSPSAAQLVPWYLAPWTDCDAEGIGARSCAPADLHTWFGFRSSAAAGQS